MLKTSTSSMTITTNIVLYHCLFISCNSAEPLRCSSPFSLSLSLFHPSYLFALVNSRSKMKSFLITAVLLCMIVVDSYAHGTGAPLIRSKRVGRPSKYANQPRAMKPPHLTDDPTAPTQVHTAAIGDITDCGVVISWVTWNTTESVVEYGLSSGVYTASASGVTYDFVDPASLHRVRFNHDVVIKQLSFNTTYYYRVGDPDLGKWSKEYVLNTVPNGDQVLRLAILGDLGLVNSQSLQTLTTEVANNQVDMVLHVGDFAYDLHTDNGTVGDMFMQSLEPIASKVPYQVCAGNHEGKYNFSHYNNRFSGHNYVGGNLPGNTVKSKFFSDSIAITVPALVCSYVCRSKYRAKLVVQLGFRVRYDSKRNTDIG